MKIYDISMSFEKDMLIYEGDPEFKIESVTDVKKEGYNISQITLSTHCGTHLDPPLHFAPRSKGESVEKIPLEILCGKAFVLDLRKYGKDINSGVLSKALKNVYKKLKTNRIERLLLKTINCDLLIKPFSLNYAHLTLDGAEYLRKEKIRLVGIDYLSIETYPSPGFLVHKKLLLSKPPIYILEGIDLREVKEGEYTLYALPLKIRGGDGGPARAFLIKE